MKIIREITSCSKWKIVDMHFQNSKMLTGRAFNYFCGTSLHVKHCIRNRSLAILHDSNMGTEACFCLNHFEMLKQKSSPLSHLEG